MYWESLVQAIANMMGIGLAEAGVFLTVVFMAGVFVAVLSLTREMMALVAVGFIMTIMFSVIGWLDILYTSGFLVVFAIIGAVAGRNIGGGSKD